MNLRNIAHDTYRTIYLSLTMGFVSYSYGEQPGFGTTEYRGSWSKLISSLEYYHQTPVYQTKNKSAEFSFTNENKTLEKRIGSFIYKTIVDPKKVRNQLAGTVILYGLDSVGLGDTVRGSIYYIKKNSRYSFGECGNLRFKISTITASTCFSDDSFVELNSNYNFDSVQLRFKWSI